MIKKFTNHTWYEVWNELKAESVFCEFKPNGQDIYDIAIQRKWIDGLYKSCIISKYIKVFKLTPTFTKIKDK